MTGRDILELAFEGNCNVTTTEHLRYLANKHEVPYQDVRVSARDLSVCVEKRNGRTYVGRNGHDRELSAFAEHHSTAILSSLATDSVAPEYDDPIPEV